MIKFHGMPITPRSELLELAGRNFCVSYAAPGDLEWAHRHGQKVLLDNGAYTIWRRVQEGKAIPDRLKPASLGIWKDYYEWCEPWLDYHTTTAVIPDVIDGSEEDNDRLIREWPHGDKGMPVFHMHESLDRLLNLASMWPKVCIGSSGRYADPDSLAWAHRMDAIFNALGAGSPPVWLHMLRAMEQASTGRWPFASADSTNIGQNHHREHETPAGMAMRLDAKQPPPRWSVREQFEFADPVTPAERTDR